jgi:hypothetical protein
MEYLPPVVVEHVLPSSLDAGWIVPGLHFRRDTGSVGVDYDFGAGLLIGARYGDTARLATGAVHDNRGLLKITVQFCCTAKSKQ